VTPAALSYQELSDSGLAALGPGNACDREPIHFVGAVQPHGFLLAVDPESLLICAASANVGSLLKRTADPLGAGLDELLGPEAAQQVRATHSTGNPNDSPPLNVVIPIGGEIDRRSYWMVAHRQGPVLILEFEQVSETESTESVFYQRLRDAMKWLNMVAEVEEICQRAVTDFRDMTGYDRVMIYRFHPDAHGEVIAEARRADSQAFLGLHYPAGDIPRQARALFLRNWIRVIADVDYEPVPIVTLAGATPADGLDLSMSVLRSVSPVHLQYLRNMGVCATMTVSLVIDNHLWGMIACHHNSAKHIDPGQRLACETLGQLISVRLRAAESAKEHEHVRSLGRMTAQLVTAMAAGENLASGAASASAALLGMAGADGAVVEIDGNRITAGTVPDRPTIDHIVSRFAETARTGPDPLHTDALAELMGQPEDFEDFEDFEASAAVGALFLTLPGRTPGFVLWLRGERAQTIRWAGRPQAKPDDTDPISGAAVSLAPRASFEEWLETMRGRSLPWATAEVAAVSDFARAIPEVLLHRAQNRLSRLALHDSLTGLPNRAFLEEQLSRALTGTGPESGNATAGNVGIAVLFVDLDGFKAVNDTHGHQFGDELLMRVAERMNAIVRPQDTVARIGGDEFVLLVPHVDVPTAAALGQRIVEDFRRSFVVGERVLRSLTLSIGVAVVPAGTEPGDAVRLADTAMYHSKRSGRNQVSVYDPASGTAASREQVAAEELHQAIEAGQITVYYQPVVDLTAGDPSAIVGFEALARWQHPTRGLVPPQEFIGLAEETGLIDELGDSVMQQALRQLQAWPDRGLTMAVNVSAAQLIQLGYVGSVLMQLVELGIAPQRLSLEITESQMMDEPELALEIVSELAAQGVQIAIDDFGTGFSSLAYVRDFPAKLLKIDRLFVSGLPHKPQDVAVVAATVQLAHSLGMRTVAEGVETAEQLDYLRAIGSDFAQGYLLGKPAPAADITMA
jgi:diguanylate cyclase (GGDEF)-like protein